MITWEYLAGFTDGEGCIRYYNNGPRITYGQKSREILDVIQEFLGTSNAITHSYDCYYLQYCKRSVIVTILKETLPFLIVKRNDAIQLLEKCGVILEPNQRKV